jgi:hypothetical protein
VEDGTLTADTMRDKSKLQAFAEMISHKLMNDDQVSLKKYKFTVDEDLKNMGFQLRATVVSALKTKNFKIGVNFADSTEFADLINQYDGLKKYLKSDFTLKHGAETTKHSGLKDLRHLFQPKVARVLTSNVTRVSER